MKTWVLVTTRACRLALADAAAAVCGRLGFARHWRLPLVADRLPLVARGLAGLDLRELSLAWPVLASRLGYAKQARLDSARLGSAQLSLASLRSALLEFALLDRRLQNIIGLV